MRLDASNRFEWLHSIEDRLFLLSSSTLDNSSTFFFNYQYTNIYKTSSLFKNSNQNKNSKIFLFQGQITAPTVAPYDLSDFVPLLVNGVLSGATEQNRQLLADPTVSQAIELFRTTLGSVVSYNLDAIQNIAQTPAKCASDPSLRSRSIVESARDSCFTCLQAFKSNPAASNEYTTCLGNVFPTAKAAIDALKPTIDACVGTLNVTEQNEPRRI